MSNDEPHWWQALVAVLGFGSAILTFLRGRQAAVAAKKPPQKPPDNLDIQERLALIEHRQSMESAKHEVTAAAVREIAEWIGRQEAKRQGSPLPAATETR